MRPANPVPTGTRTLPDFLFQPTCGPRNQLVGTAIAQQDCRGIRIEHRANSVKQFGKQILDLEPGQGRVGDCKQIAQLLRPGPRHRSASLGPSRRPRYRTAVSRRVIYINTW